MAAYAASRHGCRVTTTTISSERRVARTAGWAEEIGAHCGRTLELWREGFIANTDLAAEVRYDEPFRRFWALWLAISAAGFRERRLRDVRVLFVKPGRSIDAMAPSRAARVMD